MTVAGTSNKSGPYRGNGSLRDWPFDFDINGVDETEIFGYLVDDDGVSTLIEENFEVDLNARTYTYPTVGSGLSAITSSDKILIVRKLEIKQESDFRTQGDFDAEAFESALDRWAMICQQLQEQVDRSAKSDISGSEQDEDTVALLNLVASARDEATLAAASASSYADLAEASSLSAADYADDARASALSASVYADSLAASVASAAVYATAAEDAADIATASANAAATAVANGTAVGNPLARTEGTTYLAATAGFVEYWATIDTGDQIILYSDFTTAPTTIKKQLTSNTGSMRMCFSYLVKKGNYYRVDVISGSPTPGGYEFVPFGT